MTVEHDPEANAIYVSLRDLPYAYNQVLDEQRVVDYAADHRPIGVELLNVSHGVDVRDLPDAQAISRALEEQNIHVYA